MTPFIRVFLTVSGVPQKRHAFFVILQELEALFLDGVWGKIQILDIPFGHKGWYNDSIHSYEKGEEYEKYH